MSQSREERSSGELSSPDDGSSFRRGLQIEMKTLVGAAVGNMSISPGSRDIVLAARKGLFIIDLETPFNVPRFLPQGGTWDVADVQWNPHISRNEYIVSTSNEKLLIWNLYLHGKTSSIEHILCSHYRAITDINWHTFDPDVVISTGIDSWLWQWDLRAAQKPIMGLCAFNAGGTQVKWNRQDGNILASSHLNEVLVWDRRKGSLPVDRIQAHGAKIYGIDWAHDKRNEIVTCSLDKTIKIWDIQELRSDGILHIPKTTIRTAYPVWRARNLPFGEGILSLPQRGETALEMWASTHPNEPIEKFEGHAEVVKEFVWRQGGQNNSEFQLITWSKDKTLKFWPVDPEMMQKVGNKPVRAEPVIPAAIDPRVSFSSPPMRTDLPPALSAPVGHRAILAEVRAPQPHRLPRFNPVRQPQDPSLPVAKKARRGSSATPSKVPSVVQDNDSATNRVYLAGRTAHISTIAWLSSVKVGGTREDSPGPGSGGESTNTSRLNSRSRPSSSSHDPLGGQRYADISRANESGEIVGDELRDEANQSLQDEITSVVNKLTSSKVKLEKADLTKKRTCTFGLHGPWGESTSVFIRLSFTFPRDYPLAAHPRGTPIVDLERNPLISMKNRVLILRRLRAIREQHRPCLEPCLRFLLFGDDSRATGAMDSESSSSDDALPTLRRAKDGASSLLRGDKNLAEPRTSQGVFGVNGELICFFRAPPRIVRNPLLDIAVSPSLGSAGAETAPRLFRSPALLSDAVRRLSLAANDREVETSGSKRTEDASSILRIMSNLFTFSHLKSRRVSEQSKPMEDIPTSYSLLPTRRSTVYIKDASAFVGLDVEAARQYDFGAESCKRNGEVARLRGRLDHERVFSLLQAVLVDSQIAKGGGCEGVHEHISGSRLLDSLVGKLYAELSAKKDIQMLAMLSVHLLRLMTMPGK